MVKAKNNSKNAANQAPAGFVLFMAWVGALFYFVGQVDGLWNIIVAFFQACVWPAYIIYNVLRLLNV